MKPPSRVKLGGQDWTVRVVALGDETYGRTIATEATIELDRSQPPTLMRDTVIHELIHACARMLPNELDADVEEQFIRGITPWLLAAFRDNPKLVSFLTER